MKMKRLLKAFANLRTDQKIEGIIAAALTVCLLVAAPVYAWFALNDRIDTLTGIKAPTSLDIKAGRAEDIQYFELKNIDIENLGNGGKQYYVFCVITGSTGINYDIQLAHTTNIPFTYKLFRAVDGTSSDFHVDYTAHDGSGQHSYYKEGTEVALTSYNPDNGYSGRTLGMRDSSDGYYTKTYDSTDTPQIYAVPLYSQARNLATLDADHDFYILELSWDTPSSASEGFAKWNAAENNKETDMIYLSAKKSTS